MKVSLLSVMTGAAAVLALGIASASAQSAEEESESHIMGKSPPWQHDHKDYEFKHAMKVTCAEFVEADTVYQNYVVAYLTGSKHQELEVADVETVVSVPLLVEKCKEQPDLSLSNLVEVEVKGHI